MSNLLKQALTKGKPPKQPEFNEDEEIQEEEKDTFEDPTSKKAVHKEFPHFGTGPIRAVPIGLPPTGKPKQDSDNQDPNQIEIHQRFSGTQKQPSQFIPSKWSDYYDSMDYMENGTPIYVSGNSGPLFFCLHGAGDSACSFACLAKEIKQFGMTVAFDYRGHGESKIESSDDLNIDTLIEDTQVVFDHVLTKFPDMCVIIVGHSMGGSVASKFTQKIYEQEKYKDVIQGLIVIDVVEGTAIEALPFMESIVSSRPQRFDSLESVIKWQNLESARVSAPPKVKQVEKDGKLVYEWKVDLMKSEKYWMSWFKGLTGSFLNVHIPKLLMLAEKERMDKDLTIAQMQGRFKLVVIQDVGHYMQEDNFKKTAFNLHLFLENFRIPVDRADFERYKEQGIGKFHSSVRPYSMK